MRSITGDQATSTTTRWRSCRQCQRTLTSGNCSPCFPPTVILGMHHRMEQWWREVTKRRLATDGYTHSVTPEMFNETDSRKSGLKWEDQPCSAGSVRISMPHIPRGNKGSSGEERIAVPTYHTAVSKDGVNLEIRQCGTKDEVAAALRDQRSPNATPSGLENDKHEGLSFRHPATVEIRGISSTSDALIGLRSWDSVEVTWRR